ncbi:MAG: anti-sigma factor antagonist [Firmicutes bacterium]|nr:anti-sigma factor antagonist [Bacillota bacterium]
MRMEARRVRDSLIVRLNGELDLESAGPFRTLVQEELDGSGRIRHLILDLRGVRFVDSSGVGAILGRYREIRTRRDGQMVILGPRPPVRRVLELAGLLRLVAVADTQQQALALVKEGNPAP